MPVKCQIRGCKNQSAALAGGQLTKAGEPNATGDVFLTNVEVQFRVCEECARKAINGEMENGALIDDPELIETALLN